MSRGCVESLKRKQDLAQHNRGAGQEGKRSNSHEESDGPSQTDGPDATFGQRRVSKRSVPSGSMP